MPNVRKWFISSAVMYEATAEIVTGYVLGLGAWFVAAGFHYAIRGFKLAADA